MPRHQTVPRCRRSRTRARRQVVLSGSDSTQGERLVLEDAASSGSSQEAGQEQVYANGESSGLVMGSAASAGSEMMSTMTEPSSSSGTTPTETTPPTEHISSLPLASTSSSILPAPISAESASTTPSSPSSASSSSTAANIGIALGSIAFIALIAALIAWALRLRSHSRREARRSKRMSEMSWGTGSPLSPSPSDLKKFPFDDDDLEKGQGRTYSEENFRIPGPLPSGEGLGIRDLERGGENVGERINVPPPPTNERFGMIPSPPAAHTYANSDLPSARPGLPSRPDMNALTAPRPTMFPLASMTTTKRPQRFLPVPPTVQNIATPSLPASPASAQAQALGSLRVANLLPGDVSVSSSAGSTPVGTPRNATTTAALGKEFGTPREKVPGSRPRFLGLGMDMGLDVPWTAAFPKAIVTSPPMKELSLPRSTGVGVGLPTSPKPASSLTIASRLRARAAPGMGMKRTASLKKLTLVPLPSELGKEKEDGEGEDGRSEAGSWRTSMVSNLYSAFHAAFQHQPHPKRSSVGSSEGTIVGTDSARSSSSLVKDKEMEREWMMFVGGERVGYTPADEQGAGEVVGMGRGSPTHDVLCGSGSDYFGQRVSAVSEGLGGIVREFPMPPSSSAMVPAQIKRPERAALSRRGSGVSLL